MDTNNSGKENTNGKGMNCMQNFSKITDALLGMYPQDHEVHQWLLLQIRPWNNLAAAIDDVGYFLKSQKKRSRQSAMINCFVC